MPSTLGVVASGEDVLNDAVLWLDASRSVAGETTMVNYGKGGSALNAQYGSTATSDTNDPLLLTHTGTNFLYLPGVASNTAQVTPTLTLPADAEILIDFAADDWTPGTVQDFFARDAGDPNRWGFVRLNTSGTIRFTWYPTGSAASATTATSTASVPFTDGQRGQILITLDYNNGSGLYEAKFYTATDGVTFSQLGTTITGASTTSLPTVTGALTMNGQIGAANLAGKFYRLAIRNGIGGTAALDVNFTTGITSGGQTTFAESSANAATVTINRATSGRKSVAVVRPVLLFGTDDYLEVADNDLLDFGASDSFTVAAIHRAWGTQTTGTSLVAKKANTTATTQGWMLGSGTTTALQGQGQVGDGTNGTTATSASRTAGAVSTSTLVRNVTADTLTTYLGNTTGTPVTDATTGTLANSEPVRVGRLTSAGTGYFDGELLAVAVWRRALNANEIATVVARYA